MKSVWTQRIKIRYIQNTDIHRDSISWDFTTSQIRQDLALEEISKEITNQSKIWQYVGRQDLIQSRKHDYGTTKH